MGDELPPILEFDAERGAYIDPYARAPVDGMPSVGVACFFPDLIEELAVAGDTLMRLPSLTSLVAIDYRGVRLAVFYPGQGASLAAVSYERVLAAGCRTVVACGGAGALAPDLKLGHVVVVESALRDEGTSYHYMPPSRWVQGDVDVVRTLVAVANETGVVHSVGSTWTTDGFFRETPGKVASRRDEGCLVVDAEASGLFAVAAFRGATFGQLLYAADDLSGAVWDDRRWRSADEARRALFDLAATSAIRLAASSS